MTQTLTIIEALRAFDPNPDSTLQIICPHITDDMLEQIAEADYGEDSECHLTALKRIRNSAAPPDKMEWCPAEVLELMRWSRPENPNWKPGAVGLRGHWIRAFSCATLLRALRQPANYDAGA